MSLSQVLPKFEPFDFYFFLARVEILDFSDSSFLLHRVCYCGCYNLGAWKEGKRREEKKRKGKRKGRKERGS
jgi:hypothetical protein